MSPAIKPGNMGSPTDPDTVPPEFAGSMAAAIEEAFYNILSAENKITFDRYDNSRESRDRRMLFVAIAQGVMSYLNANQAAIQICSGNTPINVTVEIQINNGV